MKNLEKNLEKKLNKNFVINFLKNGIIAVCETLEEAIFARKKGASGILLVKERGGEHNDVFVMADEDLIKEVLDSVDVPVFVRVKFGHFGEAKICEELGVDGIVEGFQNENSLDEKLNEDDFDFVIISEVYGAEEIFEANKNVLILGEYATGKFNSIKEKFSDVEKKFLENGEKNEKNINKKNGCDEEMNSQKNIFENKNIFLGGGISSVADLDVLKNIGNISGFFVGSAIFDLENREFFEDYWQYKLRCE